MNIQERAKKLESEPKAYYSTDEFPKMKLFDENWTEILKEMREVLKKEEEEFLLYEQQRINNENLPEIENTKPKRFFELWCENNLYEESNPEGWNVAPLMINYEIDNIRTKKVPFLMSLVNQIQGLITVSFSMLKPGTWIVPHKGYENYSTVLLRYHLGLVIPKGDLGIRVDKRIKVWEEGKSFIFDDSLTHEAWNFTNEDRYVLIIDFARSKEDDEKIKFEICSLTQEVKDFLKKET